MFETFEVKHTSSRYVTCINIWYQCNTSFENWSGHTAWTSINTETSCLVKGAIHELRAWHFRTTQKVADRSRPRLRYFPPTESNPVDNPTQKHMLRISPVTATLDELEEIKKSRSRQCCYTMAIFHDVSLLLSIKNPKNRGWAYTNYESTWKFRKKTEKKENVDFFHLHKIQSGWVTQRRMPYGSPLLHFCDPGERPSDRQHTLAFAHLRQCHPRKWREFFWTLPRVVRAPLLLQVADGKLLGAAMKSIFATRCRYIRATLRSDASAASLVSRAP